MTVQNEFHIVSVLAFVHFSSGPRGGGVSGARVSLKQFVLELLAAQEGCHAVSIIASQYHLQIQELVCCCRKVVRSQQHRLSPLHAAG
jgi:hypothetical protein